MEFDLSRNQFLQNLEVLADRIDDALWNGPLDTASRPLKYALSTIQSSSFSQLSIIYQEDSLRDRGPRRVHSCQPVLIEDVALLHRKRFKLLREAHKVRDFQLVLHADVWECNAEWAVPMLKGAVVVEKARGGSDDLFPETLVTFIPRSFLQPVVHL